MRKEASEFGGEGRATTRRSGCTHGVGRLFSGEGGGVIVRRTGKGKGDVATVDIALLSRRLAIMPRHSTWIRAAASLVHVQYVACDARPPPPPCVGAHSSTPPPTHPMLSVAYERQEEQRSRSPQGHTPQC